jgi:ESCRT-I complex subunit TSG101
LDDSIYYLGEALRKDVIELEAFLKVVMSYCQIRMQSIPFSCLQHVRELSRQQFMARALIMKARSTAGLPDYGITS